MKDKHLDVAHAIPVNRNSAAMDDFEPSEAQLLADIVVRLRRQLGEDWGRRLFPDESEESTLARTKADEQLTRG